MTQGTLFESRLTDPPTSLAASTGSRVSATVAVMEIMERTPWRGYTADELVALLPDRTPSTICGLCSRLLCDSGETRPTRTGYQATVWVLPKT